MFELFLIGNYIDFWTEFQLHIAAANGYTKVVEFLLENHVNVDATDKDLWTAVHAAACWGHVIKSMF